jgi:hypothetical protein
MALLLAFTAISAFGQGYKGSIYVTVVDSNGSALPGAVVTVSASTFNRSFVTDANGIARFVGLTPDTYEVKIVMTGFNTQVRPNVAVDTGSSVKLTIDLQPATQTEELVVVAETPLMDTTQMGTATTLNTAELEQIPQSRDPWAVLDTIPAIQSDRINVGGNESGQQSTFVGHGDDGDNSAWIIDGVEFTDFAAEGASQSYLDFGSFSQIGFTTGGQDVSTGSSGAVLNFVTKQGSNEHTGSMRLLYADKDFSSTNVTDPDPVDGRVKQNEVVETFEKGFEIGGPIIKDKLWYWGAFSQNSIDNLTRSGQRDKTVLENTSLKLHGDITPTTRGTFFYTNGAKVKDGRGASPSRAPETTWDQDGPTPIYKYEISQLVGQSTELQFIYGRVDGGFNLFPKGDPDTNQAVFDEAAQTWRNTYYTQAIKRPQRTYTAKGTTFMGLGATDNEFNYGFEYKEAQGTTSAGWGTGQNIWLDDYRALGGTSYFFAYRDGVTSREIQSTSLWLQDTLTAGNLTVKVGLRYNDSEGNNLGGDVAPNNFFPDLLPSLAYNGDSPVYNWKTLSPSLGATYTFGADNQYLVRGSVRRFYDNIAAGDVDFANPVSSSRLVGIWVDGQNGQPSDGLFQVGEEIWFGGDPYAVSTNVNRDDPTSATSNNFIDPNLDPPEVDEFILGGEWAVTPGFTVGLSFTHRDRGSEVGSRLQGGITNADYELLGSANGVNPVDGSTYNVPIYGLSADGLAKNPQRNTFLTNIPDYSETYDGFEFTVTKRLSDRWMLRGYVAFQDWTHDVGPESFQNPTMDINRNREDGGDVSVQAAGSGPKANIFTGTASWTANVNGLVQLPWDLSFSANVFAREGYSAPLSVSHNFRDAANAAVYAVSPGPLDTLRMDDIFNANVKLTKVFTLGSTKVDLGIEVFNIFNDDAKLQVLRRIATNAGASADGTFGRVEETLSPRIARFSATVNF